MFDELGRHFCTRTIVGHLDCRLVLFHVRSAALAHIDVLLKLQARLLIEGSLDVLRQELIHFLTIGRKPQHHFYDLNYFHYETRILK